MSLDPANGSAYMPFPSAADARECRPPSFRGQIFGWHSRRLGCQICEHWQKTDCRGIVEVGTSLTAARLFHLAQEPSPDKFTRNFSFPYTLNGRGISVVMTSVRGHLYSHDFPTTYRAWQSCQPSALFEAPLRTFVTPGLEKVAQNLRTLARTSDELVIWTDCDREGEMIGKEVEMACREGNPRISTKRARFSAIVPA